MGFIYRADNGKDATGNEYYLEISGEIAVDIILYRMNGGVGTITQLATAGPFNLPLDLDGRNHQVVHFRVVLNGINHKIYVNEGLQIDFNDIVPGAISTGNYLGFRGVGAIAKIRQFRLYAGTDVTVTGCGASATVVLRGADGVIFATATADGGGSATLTSPHYPMYSIEVNGTYYTPADAGLIWGGDTFAVVSGFLAAPFEHHYRAGRA